jgi:hypothetical protein
VTVPDSDALEKAVRAAGWIPIEEIETKRFSGGVTAEELGQFIISTLGASGGDPKKIGASVLLALGAPEQALIKELNRKITELAAHRDVLTTELSELKASYAMRGQLLESERRINSELREIRPQIDKHRLAFELSEVFRKGGDWRDVAIRARELLPEQKPPEESFACFAQQGPPRCGYMNRKVSVDVACALPFGHGGEHVLNLYQTCQCTYEAGDSPCPVHGDDSPGDLQAHGTTPSAQAGAGRQGSNETSVGGHDPHKQSRPASVIASKRCKHCGSTAPMHEGGCCSECGEYQVSWQEMDELQKGKP